MDRTATELPYKPIESDGTNERVQVDLIDTRSEPSSPYKRILTTKDHWDKICYALAYGKQDCARGC
jgi:hypothetical protein